MFAIDYAKLQALGYKGILFDIDNTLVHHGADATPKVEALFRELDAMGMKTLLLSDNSAERIQRFNKHIGAPYIAEAGKPDPAAYRRGAKMLGLPVEQVVCIGDQVFRDIRGANRCGMASILVDFPPAAGDPLRQKAGAGKVHHGLLAQKSALAGPLGEYPKIRGAYHVLRYQPDLL